MIQKPTFPALKAKQNRKDLYKNLRGIFTTGILALVPVIMTILAVKWLFLLVDGILQPYVKFLLGFYLPGLGLVATVLLIFLAGLLVRTYGGKRLMTTGERFLERLPVVHRIYDASKDIVNAFNFRQDKVFKEVVLLEMPRKGLFCIGFLTSELIRKNERREDNMVTVFVPSVPMFTTGFLFVAPAETVSYLDLSVEEALELIISGGMVSPGTLPIKKKHPKT